MSAHRSVSPAIRLVRDFLLGRHPNGQLRFPDEIATRSPPPPHLPPGPACKLSDNYYYTRDARREVGPPTLLYDGTKPMKKIEAGESAKG
ncbi:NADH dehydrogenase [ubiquinone] 1 alpha subcomplex subunit 7 [Rhipicephalus sanguineus]|uniref:NADH dehydrogenase [ubiquinone] 1 alpha subcomplex subunit 7 n=1 Tax=Rhipicephalus sanguineus TaxID=34632 RepID=UPI0020C4BF40|nr:NADH dehydrogenase [ubiquinone] 1 alpha subcomplex subunit 7 [Rhipicephalus sanguineus]